MKAAPPPEEFALKETSPAIGLSRMAGDKLTSTYDLVEQMQYLYVKVVKAKELPGKDVTGDEAFPEAWHSDAASVGGDSVGKIRSKVYLSPKLWYVRVNVIEAQDLVANNKTRFPETFVKAMLVNPGFRTKICPAKTLNPIWNEDLLLVASEPFEEPLVISLEDRVGLGREETLGRCLIPLHMVQRRLDHKPVNTWWYNLEKHMIVDGEKKEAKFASRIHLRICLDGGYRVLDESTHYSSDLRPTAKQLWKPSIGVLELGILSAHGLMPMKNKDGRGTMDATAWPSMAKSGFELEPSLTAFIPNGTKNTLGRFMILAQLLQLEYLIIVIYMETRACEIQESERSG